MTQQVPEFQFSDDALKLRQFLYGYWCANGQAQKFVADTATNRMHRYDWPAARVLPERIIAGVRALGVDVTNWGD